MKNTVPSPEDVPPEPLTPIQAASKRALDLMGAGLFLLLTWPVWAVVALLVRLDSPGPIFFHLKAVGKDGKPFPMMKFRTMYADAEARTQELLARNQGSGPMLKLTDDPRITRMGRWLRRTSVDELPQVVNVMRGEMSLVGPRPISAQLYAPEHETGWRGWRLRVLPGITGLWQVSGRPQDFDECCRLDIEYQRSWSFGGDVRILLRTIPAVLGMRGAS